MAHLEIAIDLRTGEPADASTPEDAIRVQTFWTLPEEYVAWARNNGIPQPPKTHGALASTEEPAPTRGEAAAVDAGDSIGEVALRLTSPDDGRVYRLDPRLPSAVQRVAITAMPGAGLAAEARAIVLYLDGAPIARVEGPEYTHWWQLQAGWHTFQAVAAGPGGREVASEPVTVLIQ
jgi:hypothetical protein